VSRRFVPKIVSANDLLTGDVVWLGRDGLWTRDLARAAVAEDVETADRLLGAATARPHEVVGPFLADVALEPGAPPRPLHFREVFRTRGPSHRPDLGRQAER
jgi:hypothetical protein